MGYTDRSPPKREQLLEEGMAFVNFLCVFRWADSFPAPFVSYDQLRRRLKN